MPEYDGTPVYRRIDGLMFDGGATRTAIEVKISRADFLRESEEKRRPWRKITHRFVYATPVGLLKAGGDPGRVRTLGNRRQCSADHQARPARIPNRSPFRTRSSSHSHTD